MCTLFYLLNTDTLVSHLRERQVYDVSYSPISMLSLESNTPAPFIFLGRSCGNLWHIILLQTFSRNGTYISHELVASSKTLLSEPPRARKQTHWPVWDSLERKSGILMSLPPSDEALEI